MRNRHLRSAAFSLALGTLLGGLAAPTAYAQGASAAPKINPLAMAAVLTELGHPSEACSLLKVVYGLTTGDARAAYLLGDCHLAQGLADEAAVYYERVLRQEPKAVAVRAKLANVYFRLGRSAAARELLIAARSVDPDSKSAVALANLADAPQQPGVVSIEAPRNWTAQVSLARIYDSNANGGSIASTLDAIIGGVPLTFNIAPSAKARPDWGTTLSADGSYLHPLDAQHALILHGDASATIYDKESRYSRYSIGAGAGLLFRDTRLTWSVLPNVRYSWQNGNPEEVIAAIDGRINYRLNQQLSLTGAAQIGYSSTPFDHRRDSWIGLASAGFSYVFSPEVSGGVQLVARRSVGGIASEAFAGIGPEVYLSASLTDTLSVDASYSFMHVAYDSSLGIFPGGRKDTKHGFGLALNLDLSQVQEGLGAFARYNYVNTDSSIGLYTSDRHIVAAGLKYQF